MAVDYQYVTADENSLRTYRGIGTGREVLVNADPEGRIVMLYVPTKAELKEAVQEYCSRRVQYWWDNIIMSVCTDQSQSSHPSQKAPFANGFRALRFSKRDNETSRLHYLRCSPLERYFTEVPAKKVVNYCINLPLNDQLELLRTLRPDNLEDLVKVIRSGIISDVVLTFDFFEPLGYSDCAELFLNKLIQILHGENDSLLAAAKRRGNKILSPYPRLIEFLGWLHQKGWLLLNKKTLLSLRYTSHLNRHFNLSGPLGELTYWNAESVELTREIMDELASTCAKAREGVSTSAYLRLCLLLRSTSIKSIGDFSPELLNFNESNLELILGRDARAAIRRLTDAVIRCFKKDERYSQIEFPVVKRTQIGKGAESKPKEPGRSKGVRWVLAARPEFTQWVELFEHYMKNKKVQRGDHHFLSFNRWLDYISELESPPLCPEEVDRTKHIKNVYNQSEKTFWVYLNTVCTDIQSRNHALSSMRHIFDQYHDKLILDYAGRPDQAPRFLNPVRSDDGWNHKNRRKTSRYALGAELLDLLREIILDRDQNGEPTFNWAKTHPSFARDWIYEVNPETKETERVWWPGRAIAMYVLLTLPLRSIQVRWLDEGVGDEYIYDFDTGCLIPNPRPTAEAGRQEGIFRLVQDPFHGSSFIGLWVNTNKTKLYDPTIKHGYEIPWPNDELFSVLRIMMDWNNKYFPNPKSITFADDDDIISTEAARPLLPKFYPLFRDKNRVGSGDPNLPIHYEKLKRIWGYLLVEAENRLKQQGKQIELVKWKSEKNNQGYMHKFPAPKFDLHSLRVSGITSLIEKGIPVHIISEYIAGHASIIMTLYYEKLSLRKVREMLLKAQDNAKANLDGCLALLDHIDDPESILVWNNLECKDDSALQTLRANKGLWQVDFAGICPGALCEEGGPIDSWGRATSVPAGACGLCRYYITGPAFLYGQMLKLNNIMYSMREKGAELKSLRRQEIDLEDGGNQRSLSEVRGRCERLNRELKDAVHEWCNRYRMFQASLAMLDEYEKKKRKNARAGKSLMPLLTANTEDGLKAVVAEATNVGLVRQISLMHEVLGDFDLHKGPLFEYEDILNTILVKERVEPFLLTIPRDKRAAAANLLGEFWINSIGDDAIEQLFTGRGSLSLSLREQTRGLIEYLKSDKFVITAPLSDSDNLMPRQ
jgi:hypothetical protein